MNRAIALFLLFSLLLAVVPHFVYWASIWFDCEHGVYAIALGWLHGSPMYHPADAPVRYSLLYGPLTYVLYALGYTLFGPSLIAPKLTAFLCFVPAAAIMTRQIAASLLPPSRKWFAAAVVLTLLLPFGSLFYYLKGDPALLLLAAIPYAFKKPERACLAAAIACMLAANIKISAPLYFLPSYLYFLLLAPAEDRASIVSTGVLSGAAAFAAPFLLPGVSFTNYLYWLGMASHHPIQPDAFIQVWHYAALPAVVVACIFWRVRAHACLPEKALALVLAIALAIGSVVGSKQGAGAQHLIPLIPSALALLLAAFKYYGPTTPRHPALAIGYLAWIGLSLFFLASEAVQIRNGVVKDKQTMDAIHEMHRLVNARGSQSFSLAPGDLQRFESRLIVEAVAGRGSLLYTDVAMWDMDLAGLPLPPKATAFIAACPVRYWLVAHGAEPFKANNLYTHRSRPQYSMFDERFRQSFKTAYRLTDEGKYFDVWECADGIPVSGGSALIAALPAMLSQSN